MSERAALQDWERFLLAESHVLYDRPGSLFQQACNQPDHSTPAIAAQKWLESGHSLRPWFRHLNKQADASACLMTLVHRGPVEDCAISPDGTRIVARMCKYPRRWLNIWDALTGLELAEVAMGQDGASAKLEFSADSRSLAALADGKLSLLDARSGKLIIQESAVDSFAFSPDGSRLVLGDYEGKVRLLDPDSGRRLSELTAHSRQVTACAFSPSGTGIVSGSFLELRIIRLGASPEVLVRSGHTNWVDSVSFSKDGTRFLSSTADEVKLWQSLTGDILQTIPLSSSYRCRLAFPSSGPRIVYKDDNRSGQGPYVLLDGETGARIAGLADGCYMYAFSPDGSKIASVKSRDSGHAEIFLWDGSEKRSLLTIAQTVSRLRFSPDGKMIAIVSQGETTQRSTIRLVEVGTGAEFQEIEENNLRSLVFSDSGRRLLSSSYDRTVRVWETGPRTSRASHPMRHGQHVRACAFSPDGRTVVTGSLDGSLVLWERSAPGEILASAESDAVSGCAFSPDGSRIVSLSPSGLSVVWNAGSLRKEAEFRSGRDLNSLSDRPRILFSPDGKRLLIGGWSRPVELWDFDRLTKLSGLGEGNAFALSADGRTVAFAPPGRHLNLRLHSGITGSPISTVSCHKDTSIGDLAQGIESCGFSPDGTRILTASRFRGMYLWDVDSRENLLAFHGSGGMGENCFFSPSGSKVGAIRFTNRPGWELNVWSAAGGNLLTSIRGHHQSRTFWFFSPDESFLATATDSGRLTIWDTESGQELGEYRVVDGVDAAVSGPEGKHLVLGCESGRVLMLALEGKDFGPPVVTAWARPGSRINPITRKTIGIHCPLCGAWSGIPSALGNSVMSCPRCRERLRLGPLTVKADWRPVAAACPRIPGRG